MSRRTVLRTALAGGAAAAAGGTAVAPAAAAESGLGEWFANTANYDGVVDERGRPSVTVTVGVEANGGAFGFGPAAVRVDPGTTVTWKWTGNGGSHNVVAKDGSFESELVGAAGHTFEHTFEEPGVTKYFCLPHKAMGMKGAVVVGDVPVGGGGSGETGGGSTEAAGGGTSTSSSDGSAAAAGSSGGDGGNGGTGGVGDAPAWLLFGGGVGAALSPLVFGLLVMLFGDDRGGGRRDGAAYRTDGGRRAGADSRRERSD